MVLVANGNDIGGGDGCDISGGGSGKEEGDISCGGGSSNVGGIDGDGGSNDSGVVVVTTNDDDDSGCSNIGGDFGGDGRGDIVGNCGGAAVIIYFLWFRLSQHLKLLKISYA